jgi:hypothetical protein
MAGNREGISKIVENTPIKDDRTGRLNVSKAGLKCGLVRN